MHETVSVLDAYEGQAVYPVDFGRCRGFASLDILGDMETAERSLKCSQLEIENYFGSALIGARYEITDAALYSRSADKDFSSRWEKLRFDGERGEAFLFIPRKEVQTLRSVLGVSTENRYPPAKLILRGGKAHGFSATDPST
ncbi:MAG: hypothetical protein OXR66_09300 [Candidatus Woesearchaeota archaeon]|nr:hypothetical protein [Candidatus Woesearchaeota archaeon]